MLTERVAAMRDSFIVEARRWKHGWELHIANEGVTQCRTLATAQNQVRDYLASMHDTDFSDATIEIIPNLDGYEIEVASARQAVADAAKAQTLAAARSRAVVKYLRHSGLSVTDTAEILGISRGRVSQLLAA